MSVVTATVLSEGEAITPKYQLLSFDITRQLNRIPHARLTLVDGSIAERRFELSDTEIFEPGKNIEILARYEGEEESSLFEGLVVRHCVEQSSAGTVLKIDLKDTALRLAANRSSEVYRDQSDAEVFSTLIEDAGLKVGVIDDTPITHAQLVQYRSTPWDFMLSRAEALGRVIAVEDGEVSVVEPSLDGSGDYEVDVGISEVFDFSFQIDGLRQRSEDVSTGWDFASQALREPVSGEKLDLVQGNLNPDEVADRLGFGESSHLHAAPIDGEELSAWATSVAVRRRLALIRGRMKLRGTGALRPLMRLELSGIGDRFDGICLVSAVRQQFSIRGWRTHIELGLPAERFTDHVQRISEIPAAGLLPAIAGLHFGIVEEFEEDPEGELRYRVSVPAIGSDDPVVWARQLSPDAGPGRGLVLRPEPGDEVVVGFIAGDPRQAVILGSMFGSVAEPPEAAGAPDGDNYKRAFVTREGLTLEFNDEEPAIVITTPAENRISLDDGAKSIEISDQHGNAIVMDKGGIVLTSAADFEIDAKGAVTIAGRSVDVQ